VSGFEVVSSWALHQRHPPLPVYLAGAAGGRTQAVFHSGKVTVEELRANGLSDEQNEYLVNAAGPWDAARLILVGLTHVFASRVRDDRWAPDRRPPA